MSERPLGGLLWIAALALGAGCEEGVELPPGVGGTWMGTLETASGGAGPPWCAEVTEDEIAAAVANELGRAFMPDRVVFITALPKTRSAKIVRRAVRARALGQDPGDLSTLENPEALEEITRV